MDPRADEARGFFLSPPAKIGPCPRGGGCATLARVKATPSPPARRSRSGQTMVEYVLAFAVLIGLAFALAVLGGALRENGDRSVSLASSEYP